MKSLLSLLFILVGSLVSAQLLHFEFFDTIRYQDGTYTSPITVLNDISDDGIMVGYYQDMDGFNAGLVVFPNGEMSTFEFSSYNNTELTGINDAGFVVGKGYNSSNAAEVFQASIINGIVDQAVLLNWNDPAGISKNVGKLNNDDVAVGTVRSGTQNWMHFESVRAPFDVDETERYSTNNPGFVSYNTYGLGLNNFEKYTGWYLDGVTRNPVVFDGISNTFFPQNHVLPASTGPRTFLNDINDNNYMAVSYRDVTGKMQGTIGQYNVASTYYDANFPLLSIQNFELLGINNNNDVVGYYENPSGEKIGLYLLAEGPTLNNFELTEDLLLITNDSQTFEYPSNTFNYILNDHYLNVPDSFYANNILNLGFILDIDQRNSILSGSRNPSWPAFVLSRDEDRSYIAQNNGGLIPRQEAIIKWIENSNNNFQGNCYGMSLFTLQNLSDPNLLQTRFGNMYSPEVNAVNYDESNFLFREMFAVLQLHQNGLDLRYPFVMQNALNGALEDLNYSAIQELMRPLAHEVIRGLISGEADSSYILSFRGVNPINLENFYHAVMPFKVTRTIAFGVPSDTIHCMDPNYPGNILKVYVDYNGGQSRAYVNNTLVYIVKYVYNSGYLKQILPEIPVDYQGVSSNGSPKSLPPNISSVATDQLCDYTIVNMDNPSESIAVQGGVYSTSWDEIGTFYKMDEDDKMDKLIGDGVLNIESTIESCTGRNYYAYTHPKGMMIFERDAVLSNEIDRIANNGTVQTITNPDASSKSLKMIALNSGNSSETLVAITEYDLLQNEAVLLEVLDSTHIFLSNSESDDKNYDLLVNYVDASYHINMQLDNIPLDRETNHTIVIQPEEEGNEVIIFVDKDQDGTIEDTLFYTAGPVSIVDLDALVSFKVFPNPFQDNIKLHVEAKTQELFHITLSTVLGELIYSSPIDFSNQALQEISLQELPPGVFFLELTNSSGQVVAMERVIKN